MKQLLLSSGTGEIKQTNSVPWFLPLVLEPVVFFTWHRLLLTSKKSLFCSGLAESRAIRRKSCSNRGGLETFLFCTGSQMKDYFAHTSCDRSECTSCPPDFMFKKFLHHYLLTVQVASTTLLLLTGFVSSPHSLHSLTLTSFPHYLFFQRLETGFQSFLSFGHQTPSKNYQPDLLTKYFSLCISFSR